MLFFTWLGNSLVSDVILRILHIVEENTLLIQDCKKDIELLKISMGRSDDINNGDDETYNLLKKPMDTIEETETFNEKLVDRSFYKSVVSYVPLYYFVRNHFHIFLILDK